jgi:hypothetical protein
MRRKEVNESDAFAFCVIFKFIYKIQNTKLIE